MQVNSLLKSVTITGVQLLNEELGRGSYGRVFTVKHQGVVCAAKEIHRILIEGVSLEEKRTIIDKFVRECHQCSTIHHPNIVQFSGVYYSSEKSELPIMVMELMDTNLTSFVETNHLKISVTTKLSILYDVSLGLSYLHSRDPVVIHRDLSSNNVMLNTRGQLVAKIGDLGVAKAISADTGRVLTTAPGTYDFMPPETFEDIPEYGIAVDVFSFAAIALHVFAEEWPKPLCGQKRRDTATNKFVAVTEIERRQKYLDKVPDGASTLKKLLEKCLDDDPDERPAVQNISEMIETLKVAKPTNPGVQNVQGIPVSLARTDFNELKAHYHTILRLMPDDYELTIGKLQDYISDDQICTILSSSNSTVANKIILDCLIENIGSREEIFILCDQLDKISSLQEWKTVINKLRSEVQRSNHLPFSTGGTANIHSLLSNEQQFDSLSQRLEMPMYQQMVFTLDPNSKVLAVLKKNYTKLYDCLPKDHISNINKIKNSLNLNDVVVNHLMFKLSTPEVANEAVLGFLIKAIRSNIDALQFCDIMESLVDTMHSKSFINLLRNEIIEAFTPSPTTPLAITSHANENRAYQTGVTCDTTVTMAQLTSNVSSMKLATTSSTTTTPSPCLKSDNLESLNVTTTATSEGTLTTTQTAMNLDNDYGLHNSTTLHLSTGNSATMPKQDLSASHLQENMRYKERRLQKGIKCIPPPPLPSNHVHRKILLDDIVTKLLQATNDPNKCEITLTITGAGGFGKTTTVISLCHHPLVKEQFTDGFVFIELGPQATDPSIKLSKIYNLLTKGQQCDINVVEQNIYQLVNDYYHNLLVIIDDVWHVEDAEPLVKAFSNCKTILTTRMNDIEKFIPSTQSVTVGPMKDNEAISLLTSEIFVKNPLSQEDMNLLEKIAQDVHLWPLLLSLIRGQLSHNVNKQNLSNHIAIKSIQANLHNKGLTGFDKNNIETTGTSCKMAVKACIKVTFELVTKLLLNRMTSMILWTGIGGSLEAELLSKLWNVSQEEAEHTVDVLWTYGLVQLNVSNTERFIEVHAVIGQYLIEFQESEEILLLSPCGGLNTVHLINEELERRFQVSYRKQNKFSLLPLEYFKYQLGVIESFLLPFLLKKFNIYTISDPHVCIVRLQEIIHDLKFLKYNNIKSLEKEANSLIVNCKQIVKDTHLLCRKFNQTVEKYLYKKDYDKLIHAVEEFIKNYPSCNVAQNAVAIVKKIIPYCYGNEKLLYVMKLRCEDLQMQTYNYHLSTLKTLPYIKLIIKVHKQMTNSISTGSPDYELYHYIKDGIFDEEEEKLQDNYLIKIQEIAPIYVREKVSQMWH